VHRFVEVFAGNKSLTLIYLDGIGMSIQGFMSSLGKHALPINLRYSVAHTSEFDFDGETLCEVEKKVGDRVFGDGIISNSEECLFASNK
jgi:phenylalanine-4-hydroxylase